ncbi:MAG TPA: DUF362 domain-containing protein [Bryobacteraceae bacterium]|jgi:uncharacterized protein (DUF362 family)|nr:DUF362 domain-containing protein [Bryobacteraceae bacterium]
MNVTRREILGAAVAGMALTRCGSSKTKSAQTRRVPALGYKSAVSIVKAPAYTTDVYDTVYRMVADHRLNVRGKRIVLKPNLVEFDPHTSINTHPMVVHAAYEAFRRLGAADVKIAEGPGHRRATLDLADAAGYFSTVPKFEDLFTDLNLDSVAKRLVPQPVSQLKELYLPCTVLDCDLLVSLPKMKTHHWAGATLAMKNLFGLIPGGVYGWPKNVLHWAGIPQSIVDIHHLFPRQFAIVDGIIGMEGNGPIQGTPKNSGVLVAGSDVVAVDATCCRIMGIDAKKIDYLKIARGEDNLAESAFRQIGETVAAVRTPFELIDPWRQMVRAA